MIVLFLVYQGRIKKNRRAAVWIFGHRRRDLFVTLVTVTVTPSTMSFKTFLRHKIVITGTGYGTGTPSNHRDCFSQSWIRHKIFLHRLFVVF